MNIFYLYIRICEKEILYVPIFVSERVENSYYIVYKNVYKTTYLKTITEKEVMRNKLDH